MGNRRLVCPHCGTDELWSDEPASIMYPVYIDRNDDGGVEVEYGRGSYETMDEDTGYVGDIWCRSCGNQLKESQLLTADVYAHREPNIISVDENSDRGSAIRWASFCEASTNGYECGWTSGWFHADRYVDEAIRRNESSRTSGEFFDPGQLAYEAAEAEGREHVRIYSGDDDGIDAPSDEDASHGSPTGEDAPQGAQGAVPGRA